MIFKADLRRGLGRFGADVDASISPSLQLFKARHFLYAFGGVCAIIDASKTRS